MDKKNVFTIVNAPPNFRSAVWKVFGFTKYGDKVSSDEIACKECKTKMKYTGSTSNLNFHIQRHHPGLLKPNSILI